MSMVAGGLPGQGLLPKEMGVAVWEGQVQSWSLTLTNISPSPLTVAACTMAVANAKVWAGGDVQCATLTCCVQAGPLHVV